MKFSEQWLREWVDPPCNTSTLAEQLTLAGLEVDSVVPVAGDFQGVVVGHVLTISQHPDADRLRVCQVEVGANEPLQIVCGAANVAAGQKVPVALIDAVLPGNFKIKKSKLRGVESQGMICSETELGLAESSEGIYVLPSDAPVGHDIRSYLLLNDHTFDIELTPNRGDCLSVMGIAREVAAINGLPLKRPVIEASRSSVAEQVPIKLAAGDACTHYVGQVIRNIDTDAVSPLWLVTKLQRSGIRSISPVVDVTNYVLLELGQPLHAFDLNYIRSGIEVRFAREGERIDLLDDQQIVLNTQALVITDGSDPIALAGIKGGSHSAISPKTKDIFLESALFKANVVAHTARHYGIYTDSSHRFERGVDYHLQKLAIDRATALITTIAGGEVGELQEHGIAPPVRQSITLRRARITRMLGISLTDDTVVDILNRLEMKTTETVDGWQVIPPTYRYDINLEIDLIEELARIYGYDKIPAKKMIEELDFIAVREQSLDLHRVKANLVDRGYQEAITYSFVNPMHEKKLQLQDEPLVLVNPISSDLSTMRSNHWPGLLQVFLNNYNRQQERVRLFEMGLCFLRQSDDIAQQLRLGGLVSGSLYPEQWGVRQQDADFFDVKSDVESILALTGNGPRFHFEPLTHPALHPGQSSGIYQNGELIGLIGALHPTMAHDFDIDQPVYLFDLHLDPIMEGLLPVYETLSKFPAIKRDLALVVAHDVPAERLKEKILVSGGELLKNVQIFDIYQGKGIEPGKKSVALSLVFQHLSRTLVDAEINESMQTIINVMQNDFNATLRD